MSVLGALLSSLVEDAPVQEVRTCVHWTAVVSKHCGLASTGHQEQHPHGQVSVRGVGSLHERSALELAQYVKSDRLLEASIGMAAVNSLLEVDEKRCVELNAAAWLAERGRGKKVAIVGSFPFVPKLERTTDKLWVLERHPTGAERDAAQASEIIPQADVVAITGASLINHTASSVLEAHRPSPSAPDGFQNAKNLRPRGDPSSSIRSTSRPSSRATSSSGLAIVALAARKTGCAP